MKKYFISMVLVALSGSFMAADASPKDDVKSAAMALANETNYAWEATVEVPADSQFKPGPTDGKTEKDGYTSLSFNFGDNTIAAVLKGTNGAVQTDDGWKSLSDATKDNGGGGFNPTMFLARILQHYQIPAVESASLAEDAKELHQADDSIAGDLTDDGAKKMLSFRGRRNGASPSVTDPKGSVKYWIKDGRLVKYQYHIQGTVSFNGNDRYIDRTTTVEIKDVNTTKVDVSDDAKKALQ
jgi:hypothetical protein